MYDDVMLGVGWACGDPAMGIAPEQRRDRAGDLAAQLRVYGQYGGP